MNDLLRQFPRGIFLFALAVVSAAADDPPGGSSKAARPFSEQDPLVQILSIRRVYVDRLTGGETAAHMRDMIISSLQSAKLFVITENPDRADAALRGSAEDLVFTDTFQSAESIDARAAVSSGSTRSTSTTRGARSANISVGQNESTRIAERKHEAIAAVRLVNKDGDVIWTTTQESMGAKFRGSSADVAEKITKQLVADYERAKKIGPRPAESLGPPGSQ